LSAGDGLALACCRHADVSSFACEQLRSRGFAADERRLLAAVADCRCPRTAAWLTAWALQQADGLAEDERRHLLRRCFHAELPETRHAAWNWLQQSNCQARSHADIWLQALATTDLRLQQKIVDHFQSAGIPEFLTPAQLEPLWRGVLNQVQCGHRQQLKAVTQVRDVLLAHPNAADLLFPLLVHAVRSVRQPLARAGLSAVSTLVARHPEWQQRVSSVLSELQFA
jgi:hypothetical protein